MDPYSSSGQFNQFQQMPPMQPQKTNGKATGALVLGILSLMIPYVGFILGIIAIVLASLAFKEIKRRNEGGRGLAIAGLVCGICGTALYGIIILIVIAAVIFVGASDSMYDVLSSIPELRTA
ncbi:DUF4190 domain-containing protein [Paenibacillus dokdonensis]|uniref:DUF4190 domain-containing protein n=1 Tax=Paenibacillus dokdonensis TaxID=2567944 RepID=A0ABU6GIU7_9BACL|nr:DUF4190 domain-containing protein [Paenibacillus dokdonensis]MEC0239671.1 DUF4190 domain-containing protein [Paenibacillus dokdonensis]